MLAFRIIRETIFPITLRNAFHVAVFRRATREKTISIVVRWNARLEMNLHISTAVTFRLQNEGKIYIVNLVPRYLREGECDCVQREGKVSLCRRNANACPCQHASEHDPSNV